MSLLSTLFFSFVIALAFIVGALSVHAYPSFDWKVGAVHDYLQKCYRSIGALADRVADWRAEKKARA